MGARLPGVLAYHKIGTPELGGTWCTRGQLRAHLDVLRHAGFRILDLADYETRVDACARVGASHAEREVLVTFDDAFESFATHAWPELRARRIPVLLFVVSDFVGRRSTWDLGLWGRHVRHLDWPVLRELVQDGVAIGSHTATHRDLRRLPDDELENELAGSRRRLEDVLGIEVRTVSYPFGRSDTRVRRAATAAGYDLGFSMIRPARANGVDRLALPRSGVYVIDTPGSVLDKIDPDRPGFQIQCLGLRVIHWFAGWAGIGQRSIGRTNPQDPNATGTGS